MAGQPGGRFELDVQFIGDRRNLPVVKLKHVASQGSQRDHRSVVPHLYEHGYANTFERSCLLDFRINLLKNVAGDESFAGETYAVSRTG